MKKIFVIIIASFIFAGCAGGGLKSYGEYVSATRNSEYSDVVVYRQPGFVGAGTLFTITLNGVELGKIGNGEFLIGEMQGGKNFLEVKVKGLQGVGLNKPRQAFEKTIERNIYFKVGYIGGLNLDAKIFIQQISLQEFRSLAAN